MRTRKYSSLFWLQTRDPWSEWRVYLRSRVLIGVPAAGSGQPRRLAHVSTLLLNNLKEAYQYCGVNSTVHLYGIMLILMTKQVFVLSESLALFVYYTECCD